MSINHNYLKRLVAEMEQGNTVTTKYNYLDLAKEVIRLREKLHSLVDEVFEASEMNMMSPSEAEGAETVARVIVDILNEDC